MCRKPLFFYGLFLALFFLVIFPKGGIKIGGIPVTWGYFLLGITSLLTLFQSRYRFSHAQFYALLSFIPFQIIAGLSLLHNGATHFGYLSAFFVTFLFLPFCMYMLWGEYAVFFHSPKVLEFIRLGIVFIVTYGILTFCIKTVFGVFIHIPLLTMNLSDLSSFETSKCIERGSLFKLISTYTNGNLYGVCLLMLAPLYYQLETKKSLRFFFRISLLLTLSRTVWVGYIVFEFLHFCFFSKRKQLHLFYLISLCLLFVGALGYLIPKITDDSLGKFLFDTTLGGRLSEEKNGIVPSLFSLKPFLNISEIVYMGMMENFGIAGLFTYCVGLMSPFFLWFFNARKPIRPHDKALSLGLINYWILSCSDGCVLLIPTMAIYFGLASALLSFSLSENSLTRDRMSFIS